MESKPICIRIKNDLITRLEQIAAKQDRSRNNMIEKLLKEKVYELTGECQLFVRRQRRAKKPSQSHLQKLYQKLERMSTIRLVCVEFLHIEKLKKTTRSWQEINKTSRSQREMLTSTFGRISLVQIYHKKLNYANAFFSLVYRPCSLKIE